MSRNADSGMTIVAETGGIMNAEIIVGRLQAEGIQARAIWREGAGGEGLGMTVGNLGTAYVIVPPEAEEMARAILDQEYDVEDDEDYDEAPV